MRKAPAGAFLMSITPAQWPGFAPPLTVVAESMDINPKEPKNWPILQLQINFKIQKIL